MNIDTELINVITELVMAEIAGKQDAPSAETSAVVHVRNRLISLEQLPKALDGIHTLVVEKGAVITPSARDALNDKKIKVVIEERDNRSLGLAAHAGRRILSLAGITNISSGRWDVVKVSSREDVIKELSDKHNQCVPIVVADDPVSVSTHLAKWASRFFLPLCDVEALTALEGVQPSGWVIHPELCTAEYLERLDNALARE